MIDVNMSDNKDSVKIQHLIDEAERLPKDEAMLVLKAIRSAVAVGNDDWGRIVELAMERVAERQDVQPFSSSYHIANRQITNFVKIMRAAYDIHIFECNNGLYASNFEEFIGALGAFFNTEINAPHVLLSTAKQNNNFMEVFKKLTAKASDYYCRGDALESTRGKHGVKGCSLEMEIPFQEF